MNTSHSKPSLHIRTDGNGEIGTGHVMRSLSIAEAVRKQGGAVTFITADMALASAISGKGFPLLCLESVWNDLDGETEAMAALVSREGISNLLVDSYFVTPSYLRLLNGLTTLHYIDDLNLFPYPCRRLINYNVYGPDWVYQCPDPRTELLLGCDYAPLREEFQNIPKRKAGERAEKLLLTTGGSDPLNVAGEVLAQAEKQGLFAAFQFHVVLGRFNPHRRFLRAFAEKYPGRIYLHENVSRMSDLMTGCDLAISAGGSTLYELCACGTPTVTFAMADNQLSLVDAFEKKGLMAYVGDFRYDAGACLESIADVLLQWREDAAVRQTMADAMQALVDGQGARRLAAILIGGR